MKYIKSFETYRKKEAINEEFIGGLLKKLKNKLSLSFSKNFGSAKEVEKEIETYRGILSKISAGKNEILSQYSQYLKQNEEPNANKIAEFNKKYKVAEDNFRQQVDIEKKKFDLKFNAIIADEKNPKIKDFIQLRKLEMQSDLLKDELKSIAGTLSQKEIDDLIESDKDFKLIFDTITKKNEDIEAAAKKAADSLAKPEQKEETSYVFIGDENMEKVKSKDGFTESPFVKGEVKLKIGDKVEYWADKSTKVFFTTVSKVEEDRFGFTDKKGDIKYIPLTRVISKGEKPKEEENKKEQTEG